MSRTKIQSGGFTLVELLVVLVIVGVLISILLPSIGGARTLARRTQCLTSLREIYHAHAAYLMQERLFPPLNKPESPPPPSATQPSSSTEWPLEGRFQYNYLIYDDNKFDFTFGPLFKQGYIPEISQLFCPVQQDPYHSLATSENPWPVMPDLTTRAGYGRRHDLTEKSFTKLRSSLAVVADLIHLPKVVQSAHKLGVNAAYGDGHAKWVPDPGIFTQNDLDHPFDPLGDITMKEIWAAIDKGS